jgi:serine/threonine protein phosphatase PrpC
MGNVGDSRAYWIGHDGQLALLSTDDTWAHEARMAGLPDDEVNRADRAHEITRWLGEDAGCVTPHLLTYLPPGPGLVVLCSDGLWNYAESADAMGEVVDRARKRRPIALARHLVEYALGAGGADNVTVAVAEVDAPGQPSSPE